MEEGRMGRESFCAFCPFVQNFFAAFAFFVANAPFPSAPSRLRVRFQLPFAGSLLFRKRMSDSGDLARVWEQEPGMDFSPVAPAGVGGGGKPGSHDERTGSMYLTFPSKYMVNVHDDRTGMVVTSNSVPEPIESGQVTGEDQFVIYTEKHIIVYRRYPRSRNFQQVQMRSKRI